MTLVDKLLLACVFVQVLMTFGILLKLGQERLPLVAAGRIEIGDIALSRQPWPAKAQQAANSFDNQFQLPVLFYVGVLLSLWAGAANWLLVLLAAAFVVFRIIHAVIHVTSNSVQPRFLAYSASFTVLVLYWAVLAVAIFTAPGVA